VKKKIIFIYNPFSGGNKALDLPKIVSQSLDLERYEYEIWESENAAHYLTLCEKLLDQKPDIAVAVGGDGTVRAMASVLKNTQIPLYIIPRGSGNGFARYFKYNLVASKSIANLNKTLEIFQADVAFANDLPFINVAGVGFDAHISSVFAGKTKRGFWGYFTTVLKEFFYKSSPYKVFSDNALLFEGKAFLISVANGNQWGNNVFIAPDAAINDALLDVVVLKKFKWWQLAHVAMDLFSKRTKQSAFFEYFKVKQVRIECASAQAIHLDGEPILGVQNIDFKISGSLDLVVVKA
jgi:diacylglycerol kinase (ATP)